MPREILSVPPASCFGLSSHLSKNTQKSVRKSRAGRSVPFPMFCVRIGNLAKRRVFSDFAPRLARFAFHASSLLKVFNLLLDSNNPRRYPSNRQF